MTPPLTTIQAQLVRALGNALSLSSDDRVYTSVTDRYMTMLIVEDIVSQDWSSLTFAGQRHCVALRVVGPVDATPLTVIESAIVVPRRIVAVERIDVRRHDDGWHIAADVMTIDELSSFAYQRG